MNKFSAALLLLLLCLLLCSPALGDADGFCDPVPESLTPLLESAARDCVCFLAPDGTQRAFLILDEGWSLQGYTLRAGQWIRETLPSRIIRAALRPICEKSADRVVSPPRMNSFRGKSL